MNKLKEQTHRGGGIRVCNQLTEREVVVVCGSMNRCHQSSPDHLSIVRVLEVELGGSMSPACEQKVQKGEFEMREQ